VAGSRSSPIRTIAISIRSESWRPVSTVSPVVPPVRPASIERGLKGEKPAHAAFRAAAAEAGELEATEDAYTNAAYRRHLARVLTYRALERAAARALEKQNG